MVIVGYQGIGKSTLSGAGNGFIDLESGNFFTERGRFSEWYKPYCKIALHLSEQGYHVFTSSHADVREHLKFYNDSKQPLLICYPVLNLKDEWVAKLKRRYEVSRSDKDYRAWQNAESCFKGNIEDLRSERGFYMCPIHEMQYNLEDLIRAKIEQIEKQNNI